MEAVFTRFYQAKNEETAKGMAAYMKDQFAFLGIPKPIRTKLSKDFLKEKKKETEIDWEFVSKCYQLPEREFCYLACDYLVRIVTGFSLSSRLMRISFRH